MRFTINYPIPSIIDMKGRTQASYTKETNLLMIILVILQHW